MQLEKGQKEIKEVIDHHYSLEYFQSEDDFICAECNQEKMGLRLLHSIYFESYTDTVPICIDCANEHIEQYGESN